MVNGINDNFNNKKIFLQASAGASYVEQINEVAQTGEVQGILYTDENQQIDLEFNENNTISNTQISQANQEEEMNELLIAQMQAEIDKLQSEYEGATKNRGFFGAIGDGISSLWGGGSSKIKNKITEYTKLLNEAIKDPSKIKNAYEKIMGCELTQDKMLEITQANQLANTLTKEQKQEICNKLKEQAANLSKELKEAHDGQGWFTKTIGFLNNGLGFGTTNIKAQAKIEEFQKLVNELNPDDPDFAAKYQAITGEALTEQSITGLLLDTEAYIEECKAEYEKSIGKKLSDKEAKAFEEAMLNELASQGINTNKVSKGTEVIYDFENTSQMASDIGAGIVVGIVTTVAVIAAPFTGGASLALAAGVGAVTNLAIKASDGLTSDAGYSFEQGVLDFASGAVDGLLAGVMAGGIAGSLSKNSAKIAAGNVAKAAARNAGKSGAQIFFGNMGKSVLRGSLIAAGSAASHYTLDTVGKTGIYNLTDGYEQLENPTSVMQNEDGTYTFVYDVKDKTTGEVIWQNIEIVDSVSSDENGNIVKGNVIKTYQSNDFNWKDFGTQVAISGVAGATGAAIGSVTGNINTSVAGGISKTAAGKIGNNVVGKVVGGVAEISADATLSLGADYLLASAQRGEWMSAEEFFSADRIFSEGLNQIRGLIIGNLSAKYNNLGNSMLAGTKGNGVTNATDDTKIYYEVKEYNHETETFVLKDPSDPTKTITITKDEATKMGADIDAVSSKPAGEIEGENETNERTSSTPKPMASEATDYFPKDAKHNANYVAIFGDIEGLGNENFGKYEISKGENGEDIITAYDKDGKIIGKTEISVKDDVETIITRDANNNITKIKETKNLNGSPEITETFYDKSNKIIGVKTTTTVDGKTKTTFTTKEITIGDLKVKFDSEVEFPCDKYGQLDITSIKANNAAAYGKILEAVQKKASAKINDGTYKKNSPEHRFLSAIINNDGASNDTRKLAYMLEIIDNTYKFGSIVSKEGSIESNISTKIASDLWGGNTTGNIEIKYSFIEETQFNGETFKNYYDDQGNLVARESADGNRLVITSLGSDHTGFAGFVKDESEWKLERYSTSANDRTYDANGKEIHKSGGGHPKSVSVSCAYTETAKEPADIETTIKALGALAGKDTNLEANLRKCKTKDDVAAVLTKEILKQLYNEQGECIVKLDPPASQAKGQRAILNCINNDETLQALFIELCKNKGTVVIDYGVGTDGKTYIALNGAEDIDNDLKTSMGQAKNQYDGNCSESYLKTIAGENLNGCLVADMKIKLDEKGNLYAEEYPPCSTCRENFFLWGWLFK